MPERRISNALKSLLEFGPIILFFVGYFLIKDETFTVYGTEYAGFVVVTACFVPLCVIAMALHWRLTGRVARMQAVTTVLVVVFGGLTIWFNDERFFKMKPTIVYLLFAAILGSGLMRGRSALQYAIEGAMPLSPLGWMIMTRHTMLFCVALAAVNELVWRTTSTEFWVTFKTFALPVGTAAFFIAEACLLRRHMTDGAASVREQADS